MGQGSPESATGAGTLQVTKRMGEEPAGQRSQREEIRNPRCLWDLWGRTRNPRRPGPHQHHLLLAGTPADQDPPPTDQARGLLHRQGAGTRPGAARRDAPRRRSRAAWRGLGGHLARGPQRPGYPRPAAKCVDAGLEDGRDAEVPQATHTPDLGHPSRSLPDPARGPALRGDSSLAFYSGIQRAPTKAAETARRSPCPPAARPPPRPTAHLLEPQPTQPTPSPGRSHAALPGLRAGRCASWSRPHSSQGL